MKVERGPASLDRFKNIVFQTIYQRGPRSFADGSASVKKASGSISRKSSDWMRLCVL